MKSKPLVQIYRRHTATGITIYLHYTSNGKQIRESTGLRLTGNKQTDQETERAAKLLQADKINELLTERTGLATDSLKSKKLFVDYCNEVADRNKSVKPLIKHLQAYKPKARLADIDKSFCGGFISHLQTKTSLKPTSIRTIYAIFKAVLSRAEKADLIPVNYARQVQQPTAKQPERVFLSEREIKAFAEVDTAGETKEVQAAFLFSCLCGLRYSDISRLTADNISTTGKEYRVSIQTKKTAKQLSFTIPTTARALIKDRLTGGLLFNLPTLKTIEAHVKRITAKAGIRKHITFHTARHTFATLLLTKGADIYTISELLGHSDIKTTQIYAKIIDEKKDKTTSLLNNIL